MRRPHGHNQGFTLIELSIVLVVIGLIVGGVLVGQDLIKAAAARAQMAQIEKYTTAVNTFVTKYGGIPGDLSAPAAAQFGFVTRSGAAGDGDGNGELDGFVIGVAPLTWGENGENLLFWEDLSSAGLLDGKFNAYTDGIDVTCSTTSCGLYLPSAKIGNGNSIYTYSGYANNCPGGSCTALTGIGPNFFGIAVIKAMGERAGAGAGNVSSTWNGGYPTTAGLTVAQAYNIDKKMDDGLPTTGKVLAQYLADAAQGVPGWSATGSSPTASTCYDTSTGVAAYSMQVSNGSNVNCGLSFQMQGAAR